LKIENFKMQSGDNDMWKTAGMIGLAAMFLGGCSRAILPGDVPPGSTITLNHICPGPVFAAAESAVSQNYRIATIDRDRGIIKTLPQEYEGTDSSITLSDVIVPTKQTFRRIVLIQVRGEGEESTVISVRVDIQRRDTTSMEAFAYQRQADDRPSAQYTNTAVENQEKREVWNTVRRDYQTEQELLSMIKSMVVKPSAAPARTAVQPIATQPAAPTATQAMTATAPEK
jgi:hypothetical protein